MCTDTKDRIALAVRELMEEHPVQKITVQQVMKKTGMARQGFYYHFQDIYQVLEWEVSRQLYQPYRYQAGMNPTEWLFVVLEELRREQSYYRKILNAMGEERTLHKTVPFVRPWAYRVVVGNTKPPQEYEKSEIDYVVQMFSRSFCHELFRAVRRREAIDPERGVRKLKAIRNLMGYPTRYPK